MPMDGHGFTHEVASVQHERKLAERVSERLCNEGEPCDRNVLRAVKHVRKDEHAVTAVRCDEARRRLEELVVLLAAKRLPTRGDGAATASPLMWHDPRGCGVLVSARM